MAKVEVSKRVLFGLVGVAALAALGLAFQLGRAAGTRSRPDSRVEITPTSDAPRAATAPEVAPLPAPAPGPAPAPPEPGTGERRSPPAGVPPVAAPVPAEDPQGPAVAKYLQAMETLQPGTQGDPETLAQQVVGGLGKGDTSGLDGMIKQAQATRARLAALAPPSPCGDFHRESLASLEAGLELMKELKRALAGTEGEAPLLRLAEQANALKIRSEALELQEKALRKRFGLSK